MNSKTDRNSKISLSSLPLQRSDTVRILAVGNSFSVDAMEYLWQLCRAGGMRTVVLGNLYIGGCSLQTHWSNIQGRLPAYTYYRNTNGSWQSTPDVSVQQALAEERWDVITMQQASGSSGLPPTYTHLRDVYDFLQANKTNPAAEIWWHMTWSYQQDSTHKEFSNYGCRQAAMYRAIVHTVRDTVLPARPFSGLIPSGTAIQNLRGEVGDVLTRDGFHLSYGLGRYTAALTWFTALGGDPDAAEWVPAAYPELKAPLPRIRAAVRAACRSPLATN